MMINLGKCLDSINSCLSNVPWDSLNDVCVGQNGDTWRRSNTFSLRNGQLLESKVVFLRNLVQFFCLLIEQNGSLGIPGVSLGKYPVLYNISNLLLSFYIGALASKGIVTACASLYFKHKLLMLMFRLNFYIRLQYSILASLLQVLHEYFQDLLLQPICQVKPDESGCLEGSPFFFYSVFLMEKYIACLYSIYRDRLFSFS